MGHTITCYFDDLGSLILHEKVGDVCYLTLSHNDTIDTWKKASSVGTSTGSFKGLLVILNP